LAKALIFCGNCFIRDDFSTLFECLEKGGADWADREWNKKTKAMIIKAYIKYKNAGFPFFDEWGDEEFNLDSDYETYDIDIRRKRTVRKTKCIICQYDYRDRDIFKCPECKKWICNDCCYCHNLDKDVDWDTDIAEISLYKKDGCPNCAR